MLKISRSFSNCIPLFFILLLTFSFTGNVYGVGADCSDGCDDYIDSFYGWEWPCGNPVGSWCCTGGGCPSWVCTDAPTWEPMTCYDPPEWTCCHSSYPACSVCASSRKYLSTGTCDDCGTGGSSGGGSTTTYGTVVGRVVSDLNFNGGITSNEMWANTALSCTSLVHSSLGFTYNSNNILDSWGCNTDGAYYRTNQIVTGTGRSIQLTGVPTALGYDCSRTNWVYNNTSNDSYDRTGTGCNASDLGITQNETQHLWFYMTPNRPPVLNLNSPINFTSSTVYPSKVAVTQYESGGYMRITATSDVGTTAYYTDGIYFNAYGSICDGVYPQVQLYGWRRDTGERQAIGSPFYVTGTSSGYWLWVGSDAYLFFDLQFLNDATNASGQDRNLFVSSVSFLQDPWGWGTIYSADSHDASKVLFDRGDPDDGYDTRDPVVVTNASGTFAGMYWSGAIRYPFPWTSPGNPATGGRITVTARDNFGATATGQILLNPVFRRVFGYVWTIPYASLSTLNCVPDPAQKLTDYPGASVRVIHEPYYTTTTGPVTSTGDYSVSNIFGAITDVYLDGINNASAPFYRLVCRNDVELSGQEFRTNFYDYYNKTVDQELNLGLQEIEARRWIAAYGSNISANDINLQLPPLPPVRLPSIVTTSTCGQTTYCSSLPSPAFSYYTLGYPSSPTGSQVFINTGQSVSEVGPAELQYLTLSGKTATDLGDDYRKDYEDYLRSNIRTMVNNIVDAYMTGEIDGYSHSTLPTTLPTSMGKSSIVLFNGESIANGYNYKITVPGSVAFLVVPKNGDLPLKINSISVTGTGRLLIITDRDVEIGEDVVGYTTNPNLSTVTPQVRAAILTTGNITIKSYQGNEFSTGTIILEGPVIAGRDVVIERDFSAIVNEVRPVMLVKYNSLYITQLNDLSATNTIPEVLKPLFEFSFTSKEY